MEIEKICRTCLGLSGPLLSIYDDQSDGCIANMLREFTKTRPKRNDNLPEKVCFACISEINRCYSFKLKCENSNRTLRQLLPNAAPEDQEEVRLDKRRVEQCSKAVQTLPEKKKPATTTTGVQTIEVVAKKDAIVNQHVHTERRPTTQEQHTAKSLIISKKLRLKMENIDAIGVAVPSANQSKSNDSQKTQMVLKEQYTNEIILELLDEADGPNEDDPPRPKRRQMEKFQEVNYEERDGYYELIDSQMEYNIANADDDGDANDGEKRTDAAEPSNEQCLKAEAMPFEALDEQDEDAGDGFNFTIYDNENGETQVVPHRRVTRSGRQMAQRSDFKCLFCPMTYVNKKNLHRHMFKRHNWNDSSASHGDVGDGEQAKGEDEEEEREEEQALEESAQQNPASKDSQTNSRESEARTDTDSDTIKLNYFCELCNASFALRKSLNYHVKQNICTLQTFRCDQCERVFVSLDNLNEHKVTHVLANTCTECHKVYATMDELTKHMVDEHKRNLRNQCNVCKKVFTMMSALRDHLRTHSGERPYLCPICGKAFSQNPNLKQHIMRHAKEKKFKCDTCTNSFVTKAELFSHQRTHTGDTPFKCEYCGSTFTTSSSLLKHRRKHTGERPYACDICPMRFAALNVLKNHRRTHTGEKPYKCTHCSKGFTQKGDCQIHQRTHAGNESLAARGGKTYHCFCGKKFTSVAKFRSHSSSHMRGSEDSSGSSSKRAKRATTDGRAEDQAMHITIIDGSDNSNPDVLDANETQLQAGEEAFVMSAIEMC